MQSPTDNKLLWLWLSLVCGPASYEAELLTDHFEGSVSAIYEADAEAYHAIPGLQSGRIERLSDKTLDGAMEIQAYCCNEGIGILTPDSPLYPTRLARIRKRPVVLYYRGVLTDLDREVCIAEVGTRTMTEYGSHASYSLAYDLARAGAVVVSGMAKGVDGMAHRGALDAGGYTVAVLGCGIDRPYPTEHRNLMLEIIKNGIVLTEYKPFSPPNGWHFPQRNRIISGLCQGTLVIEAARKSGALITAQQALEQGRDLFAIPGKVGEMSSLGTNELIRDGAAIVTCAADILLEYQPLYPGKINLNRIPSVCSRHFRSPVETQAAAPLPFTVPHRGEDIDRALSRSETAIGAVLSDVTLTGTSAENGSGIRQNTDNEPTAPSRAVSKAKGGNTACGFPDLTGLNEQQQRLIAPLLTEGSLNADQLAVRSGMSVADVLVELTFLEIDGILTALPGGAYALQRKS